MKIKSFLLIELVAMAAIAFVLSGCGGGGGGNGTKGEDLPPIGANYTIRITHANLGSDDNLMGTVSGPNPKSLGVAVYIKTDGGWWTKPFYGNMSITTVNNNGGWECNITPSMRDFRATEVLAFLVQKTITVPSLTGGDKPVIPEALDSTGYVKP